MTYNLVNNILANRLSAHLRGVSDARQTDGPRLGSAHAAAKLALHAQQQRRRLRHRHEARRLVLVVALRPSARLKQLTLPRLP
jgi:hypothetical protein